MTPLVSLSDAKAQLYITDDDTTRDVDISLKILQASAIAMTYMKLTEIPEAWLDDTTSPSTLNVPYDVQAGVFLMVGELFVNREATSANLLTDAVKSLLPRIPTLA